MRQRIDLLNPKHLFFLRGKSMRKLFCFAVLIAASAVTACSPAANNSNAAKPANAANTANASNANTGASAASIDSDIKKAVADMAAALQKNDVGYMEKLYTENYMFVAPDGSVVTGADRIASMKSGGTKYESIKYEDVNVRSNAEGNGAVSISRATVKGTNLGKPVDGQFRVTHVWSKTKDGWKLANGQTTPITAAAAGSGEKTSNSNSAPAANSNSNGAK
jgi:ketosteroid isomerase-like protein